MWKTGALALSFCCAFASSRQLVRLSECLQRDGSGVSETQSADPVQPPAPG
ncbi:MAG: hypothetical protein AB1714_27605 [Acidobacteriota bacterium]